MSRAYATVLGPAAFNTAVAALQNLVETSLGRSADLGAETATEARQACHGHARLMRETEIGRFQDHLRRCLAHQRRQGEARYVLILDPAQYATLTAALWLYLRLGLADPARRSAPVAATAAGETLGLGPAKALRGPEVGELFDAVRAVARPAAWI